MRRGYRVDVGWRSHANGRAREVPWALRGPAGLVMKILKGVPPPVPMAFSEELRALVSELLTKERARGAQGRHASAHGRPDPCTRPTDTLRSPRTQPPTDGLWTAKGRPADDAQTTHRHATTPGKGGRGRTKRSAALRLSSAPAPATHDDPLAFPPHTPWARRGQPWKVSHRGRSGVAGRRSASGVTLGEVADSGPHDSDSDGHRCWGPLGPSSPASPASTTWARRSMTTSSACSAHRGLRALAGAQVGRPLGDRRTCSRPAGHQPETLCF